VSVEQRRGGWDLASEFSEVEVDALAGEQPVADGEEDDDAIAELVAAGLDPEEWPIHPAIDLRLLDDAVLGVDPVQQGQFDVGDPAPEAAVELTDLILAAPALAERHHLVLAAIVQGRNQPLQLASILGARVLDPEFVIGLGDWTLRPGFEWAALQPDLRHSSKDKQRAAARMNCVLAVHKVTMIPGDGVGPEVSEATRRVLEATGVKFEWDVQNAGLGVMEKYGTPMPEHVLASIRRNKVAIKGPLTTPIGKGIRSVNVALRKELDLYALVRPCKSYPGVRSRYDNIDLVIVRENTEDIYAGIEFQEGKPETERMIKEISEATGKSIRPDSGLSIKPISITASARIVNFAFNYARSHGRRKVTAVHKANIMKFTDGLFLRVAEEIAKEHPDIQFNDRIVDNMSMQLVQNPREYDLIVMPNLYGDILSDLAAGLVGGLGLAPGANLGDEIALFEATHGSAPKYAGANKINPMAMMLSGVMMLHHLGETYAANMLEGAIAETIREGRYVTYDMKADRNDPSAVGTSQVADAIVARLETARTPTTI
jgi:isocitrate dehydrogenase (NAD+)